LYYDDKITFRCSGKNIDDNEFHKKYNYLSELTFDLVILNDTNIKELTTTQFDKNSTLAKFREIWIINNSELTGFNEASFFMSKNVTDKLVIHNNPNIKYNKWSDFVRSMVNLTQLIMTNNGLTTIEHKIFELNSKLRILDLRNNQIKDIKDAFPSLPHIEYMLFDNNRIDTIGNNAFKLVQSDAPKITISLENNNISEIREYTIGIDDPNFTLNQFYFNLERNKFEEISGTTLTTFRKFIENEKNVINLANNPIRCDDKNFKLLIEEQKDKQNGNQIITTNCTKFELI